MPSCFVQGCQSGSKKTVQDYTLHSFPRDREMITQWLFRLGHKGESVYSLSGVILGNQTGAFRICSKHFTQNSYELRGSSYFLTKDALPSLFLYAECEPDHTYAKKRRLEEDCSEIASTSQSTPPDEAAVASAVPGSTEKLEEPCMGPDVFLPINSEYVNCIGLIGVEAVEEIKTWSTPDVDSSISPSPKSETVEKKTKVKLSRSIHTSTESIPRQAHKHTQSDKRMGMKDKYLQAFIRPPNRSIGIQCNVANLPKLSEGSSHEPKHIKKADFLASDVSQIGDTFKEKVTKYSQFKSNELSISKLIIREKKLHWRKAKKQKQVFHDMKYKKKLYIDPDNLDSNELSNPKLNVREPHHRPKATKEEQVFHDMQDNKELYIDPDDRDSSFILLSNTFLRTNFVTERKLIVFESSLDKLLKCCKCQADPLCQGDITDIIKYRVGSAMSVTAYCSNKHHFQLWRSQPLIGRKPAGNLLISAGIVCSESNFLNFERFFNLLNIFGISKSSHYKYQKLFFFPTINRHWQLNRREALKSLDHQQVAVVGDGQFDLPDHTANYCMYSFMDVRSKKIIDFQVEKVESSSDIELECKTFKIAVDRLLNEGIRIKVVCTEQDLSIKKLMKDDYSFLKHQFDIWHVAKSIGNKIAAASQKGRCAQLSKWVTATKNHLRWAANACGHNPALLVEQWSSIVYHITNQHSWQTGDFYKECHHAAITKDKDQEEDWLEAGSTAHDVFKGIVLNKKLIKDLKQLSLCHTGEFEVFHNTARKYHSKHEHYCINEMVARTQLAALDHNHNISRVQAVVAEIAASAKGQTSHNHTSKTKKSCLLDRTYEPSSQDFIKNILLESLILAARY